MRTQPINIYLAEPSEVLADLTIIVPDVSYMDQFQSTLYKYGGFLILAESMAANKQNLGTICNKSSNVVLTTKGWSKEREFLTMLYDYLEENDGIENLYVIPTETAIQVFSAVSVNNPVTPIMANGYVPGNDEEKEEDNLLSIAGMIGGEEYGFEDEYAATIEDYLDVDKNGNVLTKDGCVGNVKNASIVYERPEDDKHIYIVLVKDSTYVPGAELKEDFITLSGNYITDKGSVFNNLSVLPTGRYGLIKQRIEGDKYFHIVEGKEPAYVIQVGTHEEIVRTAPIGSHILGKLDTVMINTALGWLFARCAARDKRYAFSMDAVLYYDGLTCPIIWEDNGKGGCLRIGSCVIDISNWTQFMEVV